MTGRRTAAGRRVATVAALVLALLSVPGAARAQPAPVPPGAGAPGERLVVHLARGSDAPGVATAVGGGMVRRVAGDTVALRVPGGAGTGAVARLRSDPRVVSVERDVRYRAAVLPDDPCLRSCAGVEQWGVKAVRGPEAWGVTRGSRDVLVAVLDTGVEASHPDLVGKVVVGPVFSDSNTADDMSGHGTHVAGTIAAIADNGKGIAGLGWNTRVLSIKVLDDTAEGGGFASDVAAGVREAVRRGARVINLSLSGPDAPVVHDAVAAAQRAGVLVVAAAGNSSSAAPEFPAAYERVLGVGASGRDDRLASFSDRGPWVDLVAPGVEIVSTRSGCAQGCLAVLSGTSMASPHVAAAAALLFAARPGATADEVSARLTRAAAVTPDSGTGVQFGRLDVAKALQVEVQGYWLAASDGGIFNFGETGFYGSTGGLTLNQPVVGMAATATGRGYWLVARDGGIFGFGDARFLGSTGAIRLNQPIVGMRPTPTGLGYWLVAADGGIFAFGDARFLGSTGGIQLNRPIVGMAVSPSGNGYWIVAADGGIFGFGDARFLGSTGAFPLNRPIVGMAPTPSGEGYWLVASDGGIFAFGDARFLGSTGAITLNQPIVGMAPTRAGNGYWLVASDGGIFAFGDARFLGSTGAITLNRPIVTMSAG